MLVFRLTDENVRRSRGKDLVPIIPPGVSIDEGGAAVSPAALEWMIRYESYREHAERVSRRNVDKDAMTDETFQSLVDETIRRADEITSSSLVQKKRMALVVCKRCKSDDIIKDEKQTKSADEGMTGFYTCNKCGFSWKQEG